MRSNRVPPAAVEPGFSLNYKPYVGREEATRYCPVHYSCGDERQDFERPRSNTNVRSRSETSADNISPLLPYNLSTDFECQNEMYPASTKSGNRGSLTESAHFVKRNSLQTESAQKDSYGPQTPRSSWQPTSQQTLYDDRRCVDVPVENLTSRASGTFTAPGLEQSDWRDDYSQDSAYHSPFGGSSAALTPHQSSTNINDSYDPTQQSYWSPEQSGGGRLHEKYPSWPVTQSAPLDAASRQPGAIGSRTSSWSDHTRTSIEFPSKPGSTYHQTSRMTTHVEEALRLSPMSARRRFSEMSEVSRQPLYPKTTREFHRAVTSQLEGYGCANSSTNTGLPYYTEPNSYPEWDESHDYYRVNRSGGDRSSYGGGSSPRVLQETPPPPLPLTSPPRDYNPMTLASLASSGQSVTTPKSGGSYTFIVNNKPFYNTSTQTETILQEYDREIQIRQGEAVIAEPRWQNAETQVTPTSSVASCSAARTKVQQFLATGSSEISRNNGRDIGFRLMPNGPRIPETIAEHSESTPYEHVRRGSDLERVSCQGGVSSSSTGESIGLMDYINEFPPSQTNMLRKLSQEFYGQRLKPSLAGSARMSYEGKTSQLQLGAVDERSTSFQFHPSNCDPTPSAMTTARSSTTRISPGSTVPTDTLETSDLGPNFVRNRKSQMSLRKAFGIFEEAFEMESQQNRAAVEMAFQKSDVTSASGRGSKDGKPLESNGMAGLSQRQKGRRSEDPVGHHQLHRNQSEHLASVKERQRAEPVSNDISSDLSYNKPRAKSAADIRPSAIALFSHHHAHLSSELEENRLSIDPNVLYDRTSSNGSTASGAGSGCGPSPGCLTATTTTGPVVGLSTSWLSDASIDSSRSSHSSGKANVGSGGDGGSSSGGRYSKHSKRQSMPGASTKFSLAEDVREVAKSKSVSLPREFVAPFSVYSGDGNNCCSPNLSTCQVCA